MIETGTQQPRLQTITIEIIFAKIAVPHVLISNLFHPTPQIDTASRAPATSGDLVPIRSSGPAQHEHVKLH